MEIIPIKTKIFKEGDILFDFLIKSLPKIESGDIIVITSKIASLEEGKTMPLEEKNKAIKKEGKKVIKNKWCFIVNKDNDWFPTAGIDESNGNGKIILLPSDSFLLARNLLKKLKNFYKFKKMGVIITDSRSRPLRNGILGITLGYAGFAGIKKYNGKKDLFKRKMIYTQVNIADSLAAAAVFSMGEGNEKTPISIIRKAPVKFTNKKASLDELVIKPEDDYYREVFIYCAKKRKNNF